MNYLGDFAEDSTVRIPLTTSAASGAAVAPSSAFEAADFIIYKNGSATQKTSTNGITCTSPFDSVVGLHTLEIDTSNDTGDSGFWTTGADYWVVLAPDETVDSQTVVAVVAVFSIENRSKADMVKVAGSATAATRLKNMFAATLEGAVDDATFSPTTTTFETNQTDDDSDEWTDQALYWTSGANAGTTVFVTAYDYDNSKVKLTVNTMHTAPSDGDTFIRMGRKK